MSITRNLTSLNEVYIGKQAVAPLQKQLSIVRARFRDRPFNQSCNQDTEILKFNRLVEKQFGYNVFTLNISPDLTMNASAIPVEWYMNDDEKRKLVASLSSSKNGFKFDSSKFGYMSAMCSINLGVLNAKNITDEEILAVILHEIGHTFFQAITAKESVSTKAVTLISSLKKINKMIINKISSGEYVSTEDIVKDIERNFKNAAKIILNNVIVKPYNFLRANITKLFKKEAMSDNMSKKMIDYTDEKLADTFAAMYGYGVELHTALAKFDDDYYSQKPQSRNTIIVYFTVYKMYVENLFEFMHDAEDEHPGSITRIKISMDYLKKEISREGIDPKMKSRMIEQLDQLNKIIDDYINFPKDKDNMRIIRTYYTLLYKKFGGDRREKLADNDALFDYVDTRYKKVYKD